MARMVHWLTDCADPACIYMGVEYISDAWGSQYLFLENLEDPSPSQVTVCVKVVYDH